MKVRVVKKGDRYRKRFSFDTEDWVTLIVVILVLGFVAIQILLN